MSLGLASLGFGAASATAGTWTVNPDGSADFTSLQVAVDTVPDGSTLLASGLFDEGLWIHGKSIRIVSTSPPDGTWVLGPLWGGWLIVVEDADWVILEGINAEPGPTSYYGAYGVVVRNVRHFELHDAVVKAAEFNPWVWGSCVSTDQSAYHGAWLQDVDYARITNSSLFGATGTWIFSFGDDGFCGRDQVFGGAGGDGLRAERSFVVLENVTAAAGNGNSADWNDWTGIHEAPEMLTGGAGGNGVTGDVFTTDCSFFEGQGGGYVYSVGPNWGWGRNGPPGVEIAGTNTPLALPDLLDVSVLRIGADATLAGHGFKPASFAVLFMGLDVDPPYLLRRGAWMLATPFFLLGAIPTDAAGAFRLDDVVPDDPLLVGVLGYVQAIGPAALSEPQELIFTD
jgi:hypothetical protein